MSTASTVWAADEAATADSSAPDTTGLARCAAITEDLERLACFDALARGAMAPSTPPLALPAAPPAIRTDRPVRPEYAAPPDPDATRLTRLWELDRTRARTVFDFRPHRDIWLLPVHATDRVNSAPSTPTRGAAPERAWKNTEAAFQLSFKTKLLQDVFGDNGDLWAAYTQQSFWQVYTHSESRPFRENVFEPELMFVMAAPWNLPVLPMRVLSVGVNHQSNGRSDPFSRSWNRVYLQAGFERGDFTLEVTPWWRINEGVVNDDNPDIAHYVGRGEVVASWKYGTSIWRLQLRSNFNIGDPKGSAQLSWNQPLWGNFRSYVRLFSGYGEGLLDYNHRQTTLGLGLSLTGW
ncbi:MAG TPA: phospholipase A [Burkholderiaceae bacterium]|nr:phospholipase A [Burkholderiaceae bacterium]